MLYVVTILYCVIVCVVLQCPDSLVRSECSPTPLELLAVQSTVWETMETVWYSHYIASLTVREKKKEEDNGETDQNTAKKPPYIEHTVQLR